MSFLSSHAAFAYRLADIQCHHNNQAKRSTSHSLFAFNCNADDVSLDPYSDITTPKSSNGGAGCARASASREAGTLSPQQKRAKGDEFLQLTSVRKANDHRGWWSGTPEPMTGVYNVSALFTKACSLICR